MVENEIKLNGTENSQTPVPNIFIDKYMAAAGEAQVKVYLFLLRSVSRGGFSVEAAADMLNYTERDIMRALDYWHRQGLLSLDYINGTLCSVSMRSPHAYQSAPSPQVFEELPVAAHTSVDLLINSLQTDFPAPENEALPETNEVPPAAKFYSRDQLDRFNDQEDIKELLYITKEYFGRTLSVNETNSILYIYDTLNFSAELIEYLIEYCVDTGHRSMKYIEKVAITWHADGITTTAQARIRTASFNNADEEALKKAFGIVSRSLGQEELRYFRKWKNDLGFDMDIILAAADKCLITTGNSSFKYVDKILENWKKLHIRTLEDVAAADKAHRNSAKRTAPLGPKTTPPPGDKFRNYSERNYDYSALEKKFAKN